MTFLEIDSVNKIFGKGLPPAVKDFTLDIDEGDFVVLVGPSGCGKSTTLRMMAGLETPTSGRIYLDSSDITDDPPASRNIAMVFQDYALYPHLTVYQNISFPLKVRRCSKKEISFRVQKVSKMLGITELLERKPSKLSGGEKQRVAIGRALVRNPAVFLMDEPLSNLDVKLRSQMRNELGKLHHDTGATIIYVTHDQTEAMTLATKIVVMNDGCIQQIGTPRELYFEPQNTFVASFIGSPQINMFEVMPRDGALFYNDTVIPIAESQIKFLLTRNKSLLLGIRPESTQVIQNATLPTSTSKSVLHGRYVREEIVGSEAFVFVDVDGADFVCKTDLDHFGKYNTSDPVLIELSLEGAHLFDALTKDRIASI